MEQKVLNNINNENGSIACPPAAIPICDINVQAIKLTGAANKDYSDTQTKILKAIMEADDNNLACQNNFDICHAMIISLRNANRESENTNLEALWRLSRCLFHMVGHLKRYDPDIHVPGLDKRSVLREGMYFSRIAIEINNDSWEAHKWFGVCAGMLCNFESATEQLRLAADFKKHIVRAMELNPSDPNLYYLLGVMYYDLSQLSWIKRKAAVLLFGDLLAGTLDQAEEMFSKGEIISPGFWKTNQLYLARCALLKGNQQSCSDWLNAAYRLPTHMPDDVDANAEILEMARENGFKIQQQRPEDD